MKPKKAIVCVTNDLFTDQRVDKVCRFLVSKEVEVCLVGRQLPESKSLSPREYQMHRLKLKFTKGALFYAEYNIRLFFYLLFNRFDFVVSNDLDTLPACDFASACKGKKIVYDSHEYFTEVPELQGKKLIQKIWTIFEIMIFRNLDRMYTVNDSIAHIYNKKYRTDFKVIRNIPELSAISKNKSKSELGLPVDKSILILQGAGINMQRGAEELVEAMYQLENCFLVIIGSGDVFPFIREKISKDAILQARIKLVDKLPYPEMMQYTFNADLGFSLDKNTNPNYLYSLPNKIFDYMKAGVPIMATDLVEIGKIIRGFEVGRIIVEATPEKLANEIKNLLADVEAMKKYRENCKNAIQKLNWESQIPELEKIYKGLI